MLVYASPSLKPQKTKDYKSPVELERFKPSEPTFRLPSVVSDQLLWSGTLVRAFYLEPATKERITQGFCESHKLFPVFL